MTVFEFEDYRRFIIATLENLGDARRGKLSQIAQALDVNASFLSQVLSGSKHLSHEHAFQLAQYFELDEHETQYFVDLVGYARTSKKAFRAYLKKRIEKMRIENQARKGLPPIDQPLDERSQMIFYSSWKHSAIQLLSGIEDKQTPEAIAQRLGIDVHETRAILDFLVACGLCITDGKKFTIGARRTHLDENSPLRSRHNMNWRLKAFEHMKPANTESLFFTAPMRIDASTFARITQMIGDLVNVTNRLIDKAEDREVACLNIDWFKF